MQYTIHPQLQINIDTTRKAHRKYFENEYARVNSFRRDKNAAIINVKIVDKLPEAEQNSIYRKVSFKKIFNHEYIISGLDTNNITIYFKDNLAGKIYSKNITLFLQAQVLEPVVYYKLLEKNILLMHAAGVSDGANGYLFPAYGGTGKTTLSLGLMGEGMQFLGDDLILVEPETGTAYPYLRPLHLFTYNVNSLRNANLPTGTKLKIKAKDVIRKALEMLTNQEFLISTRVHADTIYEDFQASSPVKYKKILFLKKTGDDEVRKLSDNNRPSEAMNLLESFDLNDSLYENILNDRLKNAVRELEGEVMLNVISRVNKLEYINTRKLDFQNLSDFKNKLLNQGD